MRSPQKFSLVRFGLKTCIMLAVVFVFPLYVRYGGGGWEVFSMSFSVYPPMIYLRQIVDGSTSFMFAPPDLIALGLAECMPGLYFFYRLSSQDISNRIRRSLLLTTGSTLVIGLAGALTYPAAQYSWSTYHYLVLYMFPVLALTTFVFIPAFGHESSLMMVEAAPHREKQGKAPRRTLVASRRTARTIGLVIAFTAIVLPYSFGSTSYSYYTESVFRGLLFTVSLASFNGYEGPSLYFAYVVYPFPFMVIMLIPSFLRLVFAKKLLRYCRGIGSGGRLLALGLIAETWAFLASSSPVLAMTSPFPVPSPVPLPILFVAGLIIVRERDLFTQPVKLSEQDTWPLSYQDEGPRRPVPALQPVHDLIKVPIAYVLISRVRSRKRRTSSSN